jgi:hypothetical protein
MPKEMNYFISILNLNYRGSGPERAGLLKPGDRISISGKLPAKDDNDFSINFCHLEDDCVKLSSTSPG